MELFSEAKDLEPQDMNSHLELRHNCLESLVH